MLYQVGVQMKEAEVAIQAEGNGLANRLLATLDEKSFLTSFARHWKESLLPIKSALT